MRYISELIFKFKALEKADQLAVIYVMQKIYNNEDKNLHQDLTSTNKDIDKNE
jgi:hypothetical protein